MDPSKSPPKGRARGRARPVDRGQAPLGMEVESSSSSPSPPSPPREGAVVAEPLVYRDPSAPGNGSSDDNGNGNGSGSSSSENGNGNGGRQLGRYDEPMPLDAGEQPPKRILLRTRPEHVTMKKGASGRAERFYTNYFELKFRPGTTFDLYVTSFDPPLDSVKIRKALLRTKEAEIGPYIFDGTQFFKTAGPDAERAQQLYELDVSFPDKPEVYHVKIQWSQILHPTEPIVTQLYNSLIRTALEEIQLAYMGRHYFDPTAAVKYANHRLELWPGFVTSMRQMEYKAYLNVDLTWKVIRMDTIWDLMKRIRRDNEQHFKERCEEAILGTIAMTRYNKMTYRIDQINWDMTPRSRFTIRRKGEEKEISFVEYYAQKGVQITSENQPMLVSHPSARDRRRGDVADKLFVPELCHQTGMTEELRSNFRLMKDLSRQLFMEPSGRLNQCVGLVRSITQSQPVVENMLRWRMKLTAVPADIDGRVLPPEEIQFQNQSYRANEKADWGMAFRSCKMVQATPIAKFAIVHPSRNRPQVDNLVQLMVRVSGPLGFAMPNPRIVEVSDVSGRAYQAKIGEIVAQSRGQVQMIMVILPNNKLETYAAVKTTCSIEYGIPSQCFVQKTFENKGMMSVATKVVIQMAAKVGCQPWGLKNPLKESMVVGFDVYHGKGAASYGAMAATTSDNFASYFSTVVKMEAGLEMCVEIGAALKKCLMAYRAKNSGTLPARVFFYRDGVGEGQLEYVFRSEIASIRSALNGVYGEAGIPIPKLTHIVVTKRINTRIFKMLQPGQGANPDPGTVVDDEITCPEKYDFYLIPQVARQGTVSPVSFNVLVDESGLDADKLQRLTFKLCHGYFNWSGTVAVPAPCQYAHKLAFLTGTALFSEAHLNLLGKLHYL